MSKDELIRNASEFLMMYGADDWGCAGRHAFKYTNCGAWLYPIVKGCDWPSEAVKTADKQPSRVKGIVAGSIVEGVDQTTEKHELLFPFKASEFWDALAEVEREADEIWKATHGCETCATRQGLVWDAPGTDNGYVPVDPECPECAGNGIPF